MAYSADNVMGDCSDVAFVATLNPHAIKVSRFSDPATRDPAPVVFIGLLLTRAKDHATAREFSRDDPPNVCQIGLAIEFHVH
jgi:hypothetical protein